MKKKYLKNILSILVIFTSILCFSQDQRLSQVTKQVSEPFEMCTPIPSGEQSDFKILRSDFVASRMQSRKTACTTFDIDYDARFQLTPDARNAFNFAADIWANLLESSTTIRIEANLVTLSNPNVIGSASNGGFFTVAGQPANIAYNSALAEKLLGSEITNSEGNSIDITINMNSNFNFYYGLDPNGISPGETDFVTIVLHEIGHGLGISGLSIANTTIGALRQNGNLAVYDSFIVEDNGFSQILLSQEPSTPGGNDGFEENSEGMRDAFTGGNLYTVSPKAIAANGGNDARLYAPTTYAGGSSVNHLNESTFNFTENALMTPFAASGEIVRDPGPVVLGLFEDMGWSLCQGSLSTEDFVVEDVKINPNPFTESITINLPSSLSNNNFKVSLVDINGRVLFSNTPQNKNGELTISNLENLEAALYFLTLESTTSNVSITKKIVKK